MGLRRVTRGWVVRRTGLDRAAARGAAGLVFTGAWGGGAEPWSGRDATPTARSTSVASSSVPRTASEAARTVTRKGSMTISPTIAVCVTQPRLNQPRCGHKPNAMA